MDPAKSCCQSGNCDMVASFQQPCCEITRNTSCEAVTKICFKSPCKKRRREYENRIMALGNSELHLETEDLIIRFLSTSVTSNISKKHVTDHVKRVTAPEVTHTLLTGRIFASSWFEITSLLTHTTGKIKRQDSSFRDMFPFPVRPS